MREGSVSKSLTWSTWSDRNVLGCPVAFDEKFAADAAGLRNMAACVPNEDGIFDDGTYVQPDHGRWDGRSNI